MIDRQSLFGEIGRWPLDEQIRFVHDVWDEIVAKGDVPVPDADEQAELDRRLAALDAEPENVIDWQAIEDYVRRPL